MNKASKEIEGLSQNLQYTTPKVSIKKKMIIAVLMVSAIIFLVCTIVYCNNLTKYNNWKEEAVTFPKVGSLQPAGDTTISWKAIADKSEVKSYKVYIDNKLVATTDGSKTSCEYKMVKVKSYEAYIEANLNNGSIIYSNIIIFYVNKKGFCMNTNMAAEVTATDWGVSWYYNWSLEAFKYTSFKDLQYVPMMWTKSTTDDVTIERFHKQGYKYVLAYNEPDRTDQANIKVKDAVDSFSTFMNKNIKVGSPATALCPPWSDDWFKPFMKKINAKGMDVDFIAVHHYWNWWNPEGVDAFIKLIDKTWKMYHKPIWITEFAISGDGGYTEEQLKSVQDYMKGVLPKLDSRDYVERYAWFSFNAEDRQNAASALLQHYTGKITNLGKDYQNLGMPKGYNDKGIVRNKANTKKDIRK